MLLNKPNVFTAHEYYNDSPSIVNLTAGTSNAEGSWSQIIASTAIDGYMLGIQISSTYETGIDRNVLVDIGTGAAASETAIISNLIACKVYTYGLHSPLIYWFPIYIPAGTRISARAQTDQATAGSCAIDIVQYGKRSNPFMYWHGSGVETVGTVTNSQGVAIANAASGAWNTTIGTSAGNWHSLGTTSKQCNWWQLGYGIANATISNNSYRTFELGVGDGTNVTPICRRRVHTSSTEALSPLPLHNPMSYFPVAAGATMYVRSMTNGAANDSGGYALAYGVY